VGGLGITEVDVDGVKHGVGSRDGRHSQACLLEDAAHGGHWQVFLGMRHRHLAGLAGVLELVV